MLEKELSIGRDPDRNTIALPDDTGISSRHITLRWNGGIVSVTDERSTNGTRINKTPLQPGKPHPLEVGDQITIGSSTIRVEPAGFRP
jgi:pSer/pThr/pTyr-binding forkhead associated (FHA) protein